VLTWGWERDVKWWTLAPQPTFKSFPAWERKPNTAQWPVGGTVRAWALLDDRRILTLNSEYVAALWDTGSGKRLATFEDPLGHERRRIFFDYSKKRDHDVMAVSSDGRRFAKWDVGLSVWDAETGQPLAKVPHTAPIRGMQFLQGGSRVLIWGENGDIRLWDLPRPASKAARPEELLLRLELQTRQRLDDGGRLVPLSDREQRDRQEALRKLRAQGNKGKG